ncbi:MAG: deoxyribodipyrimidine photo-lyase [Gammaproteobacteria bacterium]|nr:deoxyribodipyrimidine photo-lyase [Gammaproteobacteria bacterium]
MKKHLVWFRNDLRVDDNPALLGACRKTNEQVFAVYCYCPEQFKLHDVGANQQAIIGQALNQLITKLKQLSIPLIVVAAGDFNGSIQALLDLIKVHKISDVHYNIEYAYNERERDRKLCEQLKGVADYHRYVADSLTAPWDILNQQGQAFKVFTPYSKVVKRHIERHGIELVSAPTARAKENYQPLSTDALADLLAVKPTANHTPDVSEQHAAELLEQFIDDGVADYHQQRDLPARKGTSQLSPMLAIGTLSVRRAFAAANRYQGEGRTTWISELIWRDFYRAVMWHFPHVGRNQAFLSVDKHIKWNRDAADLDRWQTGKTGVPIVDAAIRQLLDCGWMHNRLRMVVASFLCKNLWIDWRQGERFFAQHLFDFDFASNNGGWQWSASVGTDAAPYFRVFNPVSQAQRFDPDGDFVRKYLPELAAYSGKQLLQFEDKPLTGYPRPMVDIKKSRKQAIAEFKLAKESSSE